MHNRIKDIYALIAALALLFALQMAASLTLAALASTRRQ